MNDNKNAIRKAVSMEELAKGLSIGLTRPECTDGGTHDPGVGLGGGWMTASVRS
ncbi:hypothetical protein LJR255_001740 [Pararhizobium sp. LjRoot255]|uniref:hypothetical protein n=1 Tax=Pararhizobium sp. LjRoot255 TaxID=3342298 RepID=UPI003ECE93E4